MRAVRRSDFYREMYRALPSGSIVMIAVPDPGHETLILEALEAGFHVVTVKSLCTSYEGTRRIRDLAREKGLFVGIDFHKRWDYRALIAHAHWKEGFYGVPRAARATMIEADAYIRSGSSFEKHFVPETSDPATYVGCHYVDQFGWFTGLRPKQVVVNGVLGRFESGTPCYSWAATQLTYDHCVLQVINGLQHPGDHRGRNHQGLEIWGYNPKDSRGTYFCHLDNLRGMDYVFCRDRNPGRPTDAGSDYVGFIPRSDGTPGKEMVGYGWRAIESLVKAAIRVQERGDLTARRRTVGRDRHRRPHPHAREHLLPWACLPGDEGIDRGTGDARGHRLRPRCDKIQNGRRLGASSFAPPVLWALTVIPERRRSGEGQEVFRSF